MTTEPARVYGCYWYGFGDLWANCNRVASLAQTRDVRFSAYAGRDKKRRDDRTPLIRDILDQLDLDTSGIEIVPDAMHPEDPYSVRNHLEPFLPTRVRWPGGAGRIVSYQLATHSQHRPQRFLPEKDLRAFLDWCDARTYRAIDLSRPQPPRGDEPSLAQCIRLLADSDFFVGIDSGMSHVAHSVGVPIYLYDWQDLDVSHPGKIYDRFRSAEELAGLLARV